MKTKNKALLIVLVGLSACASPALAPSQIPPPTIAAVSGAPTSAPQATRTSTRAPTPTATATLTPAPTVTPTYTHLRGEVLERANCRYGPGAPYLYKYGLVAGSNLDVIGRLDDASWLYVQAIGGDNPCWVKATLMNVKGDVFSIEPLYPDKAPLPVSPYYAPLALREVTREGDQVAIRWYGQTLRAGDEEYTGAPLYLVEIWACENGAVIFRPYGLSVEQITVADESGCAQPSHGRIYFSEKHGYAGPTEIEWP